MRTRRVTLALAALLALLVGPAAARADVLDTIKWKTDTLTVKRAGADGAPTANIVLLVSNGKDTIVVKFSYDVPLSINFADRALRQYGVPSPDSIALATTDPRAVEARAAIKPHLAGVGIKDKDILDCPTLAAFELIKGVQDQPPVGVADVLVSFRTEAQNTKDPMNAVKKAQLKNLTKDQLSLLNGRIDAVRLLLRTLNDADQAKLLGRLYLLDAFLGNEDRLQRGGAFGLNWRNLMLGTVGTNKDPGFVAIDNRAFAPSLRELAWVDNVPKAKAALKNQAPGKECEADLSSPDILNRGRADWVERLIRPRKEKGEVLDVTDELGMKTGNLSRAFDFDGASKAVVNDLRKQVHQLLFKDMRDGWQNAEKVVEPVTLGKNAPDKIPGFRGFGDPKIKDIVKKGAVPKESDDRWAFALAYPLEAADTGLGYGVPGTDWGKVRENIRSGKEKAAMDLAEGFPHPRATVDDKSLANFKTEAVAKLRQDAVAPAPGYADAVAEDALFVRQAYVCLRWFSKDRKDDSKDKDYLRQITAAFRNESDKATGKLDYVLTAKPQQVRRK